MEGSPAGILGTGSYVPATEVTNEEIARRFDVTEDWILRKTRVRSRRHVSADEATSDLAVRAAWDALADADVAPESLDHVIVATTTPDSLMPPAACLTQAAIGADRAAAFDINVGCSGFAYALAIADALLSARPGGHALVIGADTWSRFTDPSDRSTAVLLADAAGAVVLGPGPGLGRVVDSELRGHGADAGMLTIRGGGSRHPATHQTVEEHDHYLRMEGRAVTAFVRSEVPPLVHRLLGRAGVETGEVAHLVPHQANGALLETLRTDLDLEGADLHTTVESFGNSGAASLPVTLDHAHRAGALKEEDLVLLTGFGGGMAVGANLVRWYGRGNDE